ARSGGHPGRLWHRLRYSGPQEPEDHAELLRRLRDRRFVAAFREDRAAQAGKIVMTRSYSPEQHYLAFDAWPIQDKTMWATLTEAGPTILDDRGAFADSRPRTNMARQKNYSHWLNHIMLNHPGLLPLMPAARIRPETLKGWLA